MMIRRNSTLLLIAAALAAPGFAASPTTAPQIDWAARLHLAMAATGSAGSVADELAHLPNQTPEVLHARVRASLESGDLTAAADLLAEIANTTPADTRVKCELAYVQELLARPDAAEQTLKEALPPAADPASRGRMMLRLAALAFDAGRPADAAAWLDKARAADPSRAVAAGLLADLFGQYRQAVGSLSAAGNLDVPIQLIMGNAALKANETDVAAKSFAAALDHATRRGDRLYARERLIATARQAGTLTQLADTWLAEKQPPVEQLLPLATVLRELNRVSDLLAWWRHVAADPSLVDAVLADRFVAEVLGAAESAGRGEDALSVCRAMLEHQPDSPQWFAATLRELLALGRGGEADAMLRTRLESAGDVPQAIDQVARTAKALGRNAIALEAANQLTALGGSHAVAGRLLEYSIDQSAGRADLADAALNQAADAAAAHPSAIVPVINALETAGHNAEAIHLLQQSTVKNPDEEALSRLASLLVKVGRNDEAIEVLERLRQTASGPTVRYQAAQQMLKAAIASNTTAQLAGRLRAELDAGQGDEQDLSLLVDAEMRLHRPHMAASEILHSKVLDNVGRLRQLAVFYLRQKDGPHAIPVLKQLATADPQNATESLERLAAVASSIGQTDEATAAVEQIRQRAGSGPLSLEMMAGVLDRLGRHAEAATYYRRVLADAPQDADDWLLWATAMSKAGDGVTATHRLQVLCGEADSDSTFAAAVDGLLNLNAPTAALRVARRDTLLRLADRPQQMLLYHVLADLSDELGDTQANLRATEASVSVSDEERPERLRELIDLASQTSMTDTAVDCGRTLLALGDDFPPQLFLQIGEQLLIGGRMPDALRAFARAAEVSNADLIAPRAAELLMRYGDAAEALKILAPLADLHRTDASFNAKLASLNESLGNTAAAYGGYLALVEQSCRTLATDSTAPMEIGASMGFSGAPAHRIAPLPMQDTLSRAAVGALATARTPQQKNAVLDLVETQVRRLMADDVREPSVGLIAMVAVLRDVAFAVGSPEAADRIDDAMIQHWPADTDLKTRAVLSRTLHGRSAEAYDFAVAHHAVTGPWLGRYARVFHPGATTMPAKVTPEWAAEALPPLTAYGPPEEAEEILAALARDTPGPSTAPATPVRHRTAGGIHMSSPFHNIVISAAALGDDATATRWALAWADTLPDPQPESPATRPGQTAVTPGGGRSAEAWMFKVPFTDMVTSVWPALSRSGRAALVRRIAGPVARIEDPLVGIQLSTIVLRMAADAGEPIPEAVQMATRATCGAAGDGAEFDTRVADVFGPLPIAARPQYLRAAFAGLPSSRRLALLTAVVARANGPLDEATTDTITALAREVPTGQVLGWNDWIFNPWQPDLLRTLADTLRHSAIDQRHDLSPADRTALAVASANIGDAQQADRDASDAIAAIDAMSDDPGTRQAFEPDRVLLLRLAVSALTPQARAIQLARTDFTDAQATWNCIRRVTLLDAGGDRSGSLTALRAGLAIAPNDLVLNRLYITRLQKDGRLAELAALRPKLGASDAMATLLRAPVVRALRGLYRLREMQSAVEDPGPMVPDFMTPEALHDSSGLATAMRATLQDARGGRLDADPAVTPDAGGIASGTSALQASGQPVLFSELSHWPGTLDDALRTAHLADFDGTDLFDKTPQWLATLIAQAATDSVSRDQILAELSASAEHGSLSRAERLLVTRLATLPGVQVPPALIAQLWPAALSDDTGVELPALGNALAAQHLAGAERVQRFAQLELAGNGDYQQVRMATQEVSPQMVPDDSSTARSMSLLALKDPTAAGDRLGYLLETERLTPRDMASRLLFAELVAQRGDIVAFRAQVLAALHDFACQQAAPVPGTMDDAPAAVPDIRLCLPAKVADARQRTAIVKALSEALATTASQWPAVTDLTRMTVAVGAWANEQGDSPAAEQLLEQAKALATRQGTGEHQLWVADLARLLGHPSTAMAIEQAQLADRCLPSVRIPSLLERLRLAGKDDVAKRLSLDASLYCGVPDRGRGAF